MNPLLLFLTALCGAHVTAATPLASAAGASSTNFYSFAAQDTYYATRWGPETNGLQFGVRLPYQKSPLSPKRLSVATYVFNAGRIDRPGLLRPPSGHRLDLTLTRRDGRAVPMTRQGRSLCKEAPHNMWSRENSFWVPPRACRTYDDSFDPLQCFKIERAGNYILTLKPRLSERRGHPNTVQIQLQGVTIEIAVTEGDIEK